MMGEPEVKKMKSDDENGDEEMTVQFEDENGERWHERQQGTPSKLVKP